MGMEQESGSRDILPRLKINSQPIMAMEEVKGKKTKVEVVPAGAWMVEIDGKTFYSETITFRPFLQRFQYKRYHEPTKEHDGYYQKTVMATSLKADLKDTNGTVNCGRPDYVKDWDAASEKVKSLIRSVKRARVLFGTVSFDNPVDAQGNTVELDEFAAQFETSSKESFAALDAPFNACSKRKTLPIQTTIQMGTEPREKNDGSFYYVISILNHDAEAGLEMDDATRETFANFADYVNNHNEYVEKRFAEANGYGVQEQDEEAAALLERMAINTEAEDADFIDVPTEDEDTVAA